MKKQIQFAHKGQHANFSSHTTESSHNSSQKFDGPLVQSEGEQCQQAEYVMEKKQNTSSNSSNSNFDMTKLSVFCSNQGGNCTQEDNQSSEVQAKGESKENLLKFISGMNSKKDKVLTKGLRDVDEKKSQQNFKKSGGDLKQKSGKNLAAMKIGQQTSDLTEINKKKNSNLNATMNSFLQKQAVQLTKPQIQSQVKHTEKSDSNQQEIDELDADFQNIDVSAQAENLFANQIKFDPQKSQQLQEIKEIFNNYQNMSNNQPQQQQSYLNTSQHSSEQQLQQSSQSSFTNLNYLQKQPLQQLLFQQQQQMQQSQNFSNEQFSNQYESFNSTPFCTPREPGYQNSPQIINSQQQQQQQSQQLFSHTPQKQENFGKQQFFNNQSSFISTTESTAHDSDNFFTPRLNTTTNNLYQNSANKLLDSSLDTVSSDFSHSQNQFFNNQYSNIYKKSFMNYLQAQQQQQNMQSQQQQQLKNIFQNKQGFRGKQTTQVSDDIQFYHIDIQRDGRTTLMIKNIPNKYSQEMLKKEIDMNFFNCYNFLYLPIDHKNMANNGYAFINFIQVKFIPAFLQEFNHKKWRNFNSEKICSIKYARIQGLFELQKHFQFSTVMNHKDQSLRPFLLYNKQKHKIEQILQDQREKMNHHLPIQSMNPMPIIEENEQFYNPQQSQQPQQQQQINVNYYQQQQNPALINYQQNFNFGQNLLI